MAADIAEYLKIKTLLCHIVTMKYCSEYKLYKYGIFSWFGYSLSFEKRIILLKKAGFGSTSFWLHDKSPHSMKRISSLLMLLFQNNMKCDYLHAPYFQCNTIWRGNNAEIELLLDTYKEYIDFCAEENIPILVVHAVKGVNPPALSSKGLNFYKKIIEYTEKKQVKVALENTKHPKYIDFLLKHIDSDWLGLCYDSSHDLLYSCQPGKILQLWGRRLFATHFSENEGAKDIHKMPLPKLDRWKPIISAFPLTYNGSLSLEVVKEKHDQTGIDEYLQQGMDFLTFFQHHIV